MLFVDFCCYFLSYWSPAYYSPVHIFFIRWSPDGCLDCFRSSAVVNCITITLPYVVPNSFRSILRRGVAELSGTCFQIVRTLRADFYTLCGFFFHQRCGRAPSPLHLHPCRRCFFAFLMMPFQPVRWNLSAAWICISPTADSDERFFIQLLAICTSCPENCLIKSFAHFLIGLFGFFLSFWRFLGSSYSLGVNSLSKDVTYEDLLPPVEGESCECLLHSLLPHWAEASYCVDLFVASYSLLCCSGSLPAPGASSVSAVFLLAVAKFEFLHLGPWSVSDWFLTGWKVDLVSVLHVQRSNFPGTLCRRVSFSSVCSWPLWQESDGYSCTSLFLCPLFSSRSLCLFPCQCRAVFLPMTL